MNGTSSSPGSGIGTSSNNNSLINNNNNNNNPSPESVQQALAALQSGQLSLNQVGIEYIQAMDYTYHSLAAPARGWCLNF